MKAAHSPVKTRYIPVANPRYKKGHFQVPNLRSNFIKRVVGAGVATPKERKHEQERVGFFDNIKTIFGGM
jgi:hypothetical protein